MVQLFILTIAHFISDFFLQIKGIGEHKRGFNKYMVWHVMITSILFFVSSLFLKYSLTSAIYSSLAVFVSHFAIDVLKQEFILKNRITIVNRLFWILLGMDQILHVSVLFICIQFILK